MCVCVCDVISCACGWGLLSYACVCVVCYHVRVCVVCYYLCVVVAFVLCISVCDVLSHVSVPGVVPQFEKYSKFVNQTYWDDPSVGHFVAATR